MIIMPAFQAGDEGLIPSTRSIANAPPRSGVFAMRRSRIKPDAQSVGLIITKARRCLHRALEMIIRSIPSTRSIAMIKSTNLVKIYLLLWLAISIVGFLWTWKINLDYNAMGRPGSDMGVGMMSVFIVIPSFIFLLLSSIGLIFVKLRQLAVIMLGLAGVIFSISLPWLSLCIAGSTALVYRLGQPTANK